MDMQNVSNLQIPEGAVRTIHDKDSRLIWGRVAYNTKYAGDTYQQTYSGKNLWQIRKENQTVGQVTYTYNQDGTFSLSGDPTGGGTVKVIVPLASSGITPGQTYTIWTDHGIGWGENQVMYYIQSCKADGTWVANIATFTNAVRTQTVASTDEQYIMFVLSWSANGNYTNFNNVKTQLIAGSTADSDFEPYTAGPAPNPDYPQDVDVVTGGQTIEVTGKNKINGSYSEISQTARCTAEASGNGFKITSTTSSGAVYVTIPIPNIASLLGQTVTVSYVATGNGIRARFFYLNTTGGATGSIGNSETVTLPNSLGSNAGIGVVFYTSNNSSATYNDIQLEIGSTATAYELYQSHSYTIGLGSLELCKIGTYQDYIYKNGDDWYVHKETNRAAYSASDIQAANSYSNIVYAKSSKPTDSNAYGVYGQKEMFCNHATATGTTGTWNSTQNIGKILSGADTGQYWYGFAVGTTLAQMQAALDGCEVYYILATPTDTQIIDGTLISQLNAIHEWLTRYGYNATVTGNLPLIVDRTNL